MKSENKKETIVEYDQNTAQSVDKSRRSFSKRGLIAPVMLTLANRSAWGGTNMCTQSGFTSFQAGVSAGAASNVKNDDWKTPVAWASATTWPDGFGRATKTNNNKFTSDDWRGSKSLTQVQSLSKVYLVKPTFSTSANAYLTLLAALNGNDLLAYQIATVFNNTISPVPDYFLTTNVSLTEYQEFYNNCVA